MLMPASTQRAHFEPAWRGDSLAGINKTARRRPGRDGIRAIDVNFQWAWGNPADRSVGGVAFALHWGKAPMNNFHFILEPGAKRARRMTRAERRRPIAKWRAAEVLRWRRTWRPLSARPRTYEEMARHAVAKHVVMIGELKAGAFASGTAARHVVDAANRAGHPPWFMALYGSMPRCQAKCAAIQAAGGQFAVIFGRYGRRYRPAFKRARQSWAVQPTRVW